MHRFSRIWNQCDFNPPWSDLSCPVGLFSGSQLWTKFYSSTLWPTSSWHVYYYIDLYSSIDIWRTTYLPRIVNVVFKCPHRRNGLNFRLVHFLFFSKFLIVSSSQILSNFKKLFLNVFKALNNSPYWWKISIYLYTSFRNSATKSNYNTKDKVLDLQRNKFVPASTLSNKLYFSGQKYGLVSVS